MHLLHPLKSSVFSADICTPVWSIRTGAQQHFQCLNKIVSSKWMLENITSETNPLLEKVIYHCLLQKYFDQCFFVDLQITVLPYRLLKEGRKQFLWNRTYRQNLNLSFCKGFRSIHLNLLLCWHVKQASLISHYKATPSRLRTTAS